MSCVGCGAQIGGELIVAHDRGSEEVFDPVECASGEPLLFFGVDLWGEGDQRLRFLHEPADGPAVILFARGSDVVLATYTPRDCDVFDGELERTDEQINDIWALEGFLRLECAPDDAPAVWGEISFERCAD